MNEILRSKEEMINDVLVMYGVRLMAFWEIYEKVKEIVNEMM